MAHQQKERMSKHLHGHAQYMKEINRWGAWVREPMHGGANSWIFLGSHLTQRLSARCQDRALLKLERDARISLTIKLTFKREDYKEDEPLRNTLSRDQFFDILREECQIQLQSSSLTTCLHKFVVEDRTLGNLSSIALDGPFFDIDLEDDMEYSQKFTGFPPEIKNLSTITLDGPFFYVNLEDDMEYSQKSIGFPSKIENLSTIALDNLIFLY